MINTGNILFISGNGILRKNHVPYNYPILNLDVYLFSIIPLFSLNIHIGNGSGKCSDVPMN